MEEKIAAFKKEIWTYYRKNKRAFPWRETTDPYKIVVSEVMLQQTQTSRVVPKYENFITKFPDFKTLHEADLHDVLVAWKGLGYNRRAIALKKIADSVFKSEEKKLPTGVGALDELPGIGKATAASIAAFAYNSPTVFIETNIRRVFIHFFFGESDKGSEGEQKNSKKKTKKIDDKALFPLIEDALDKKEPREWYYALMDYGAMLSKTTINPNRKSAGYIRQAAFKGSNREIRGAILKEVTLHKKIKTESLLKLPFAKEKIQKNIDMMTTEGFFIKDKTSVRIKN